MVPIAKRALVTLASLGFLALAAPAQAGPWWDDNGGEGLYVETQYYGGRGWYDDEDDFPRRRYDDRRYYDRRAYDRRYGYDYDDYRRDRLQRQKEFIKEQNRAQKEILKERARMQKEILKEQARAARRQGYGVQVAPPMAPPIGSPYVVPGSRGYQVSPEANR